MKRILCVWLPRWPIQRLRRQQRPGPEPSTPARPGSADEASPGKQPLVLYAAGVGGQLRVTACSPGAARCGIRPGLPLAEAQALGAETGAGTLRFEPHDRAADRLGLRQLALWCLQFTPIVAVEEVEEPDSLLLDVAGCGHLFGGEAALARKVVHALRRNGCWTVAAAVADTAGAAWAVAHFGAGSSHKGPSPAEPVLVPPGGQAEALRPLAVEALRLSGPVVQLLHTFDLRRIGQLLALPRADLVSRFTPEAVRRLDQALGDAAEPLTPEQPDEPVEASWSFEPPVADRFAVEAVLEQLLEQVLERIRPRQLSVQKLLCSLQPAAGPPLHVPVNLLQSSDSARHLLELVRLHLERLFRSRRGEGMAEVSAVTVRVAAAVPREFHQAQLFEGDAGARRWQEFHLLIERLSHRLGEQAVLRPRLWPDAQPELAFRCAPWLGEKVAAAPQPPPLLPLGAAGKVPLRPACLKARPVALAAVPLGPGGPPLYFPWRGQRHRVGHFWGPERIETGWWRERDVRRNYYLVETTAGKRFWLFRTLPEGAWFLHGTFA
jgi:protein ImuB